MMPEVDGLDILRYVRSNTLLEDLPVISEWRAVLWRAVEGWGVVSSGWGGAGCVLGVCWGLVSSACAGVWCGRGVLGVGWGGCGVPNMHACLSCLPACRVQVLQ